MMGQLVAKEVDICGVSLTLTAERSQFVDFTIGIMEIVNSIYMLDPAIVGGQGNDVNLMVFLTVFSKVGWLGILTIALVSSLTYAAIVASAKDEQSIVSSLEHFSHFSLGFYNFFLSLVQRKVVTEEEERRIVAARILAVTTSILTFVLFSYYAADLTATMTAGSPTPKLKSFTDILESNYRVFTQEGTVHYDFLRHAEPGSPMKKIYEERMVTMHYKEFGKRQEESLDPMNLYFSSEFAFPDNNHFTFLRNFDGRLVNQLAFPLQKDSEFRNIFNYYLVKTIQSGLLKKLSEKWVDKDRPEDWSHRIFQEEAKSLGYDNIVFPMVVMLVGMVTGICLVWAEKAMGGGDVRGKWKRSMTVGEEFEM